ncbi:MAG: hypothetical protein ACYC4Q_05885 [Victivallaceae bacterium]
MQERSKSVLNAAVIAAGPLFLLFMASELDQLIILLPCFIVVICIGLPSFHLLKSERRAFMITALGSFLSCMLCLALIGLIATSQEPRAPLHALIISTGISILPSFISLTWLLMLIKRRRDRRLQIRSQAESGTAAS